MSKGIVKDESGVERALEFNVGVLNRVTFPERGKRNGSVEISVPGMEYVSVPSVDMRDLSLVEDLRILEAKLVEAKKVAVKAAADTGSDDVTPEPLWVGFRAEVVRDQKVDTALAWAEVPADKEHRHKRLVAVAEDQTPAAAALLAQAEFECKAGRLGAEPTSRPEPAPNQPTGMSEPMRSGGGQADTWAFSAAMAMTTWAFEAYQEQFVTTGATFKGQEVHALAARYLAVADHLQTVLTDGRPVNRNANSHTRVRGVLRTVVERHPAPVDLPVDGDGWQEWQERITKSATLLLQVAKDLHREDTHPQPQAQTPEPQPEPEPQAVNA